MANTVETPERVAIDCRTLQDRPIGGVGRSLGHMLPHLAATLRVDALIDSRRPEPDGLPDAASVHPLRGPLTDRGVAWLQVAAPRWLRGYEGVFHCPFYGLPYWQPVPMVVTIHDLTFEFAPRWQSAERNVVFRRQARWAARTAGRVIVHSDHVRETVLERYARFGATSEQIVVIAYPPDPRFRPDPDDFESRLTRLGIRQPYVVALGGAPRRQLDVSVAAWTYAIRSIGAVPGELPLAVVGTERPRMREGVLYIGAVDDADWAAVLAGASAFCYATLYEGYGVPAIEAAVSRTPVVCASVGSLPELLGDAAAWAPAPAAEPLGEALAGVLADPRYAHDLAERAERRVLALPSWSEVASLTLRAYRDAARG